MARFKARYIEEEPYYPIEIVDTYDLEPEPFGCLIEMTIDEAEQLRDVLTVIIDEAKARLEANDGTHD